jgi:hypothetical protein
MYAVGHGGRTYAVDTRFLGQHPHSWFQDLRTHQYYVTLILICDPNLFPV